MKAFPRSECLRYPFALASGIFGRGCIQLPFLGPKSLCIVNKYLVLFMREFVHSELSSNGQQSFYVHVLRSLLHDLQKKTRNSGRRVIFLILPLHTKCSGDYSQTTWPFCASLSLSTHSRPMRLSDIPVDEKFLKGKCFGDMEEVKQKR